MNMKRLRLPAMTALLIVVLGLAARLYLAAAFVGNYDERSYEIVSSVMRAGGNVYGSTDRYNYSPVWAYVLLLLDHIRTLTGLPAHLVIRGALSLVDTAAAIVLAAIAARVTPGGGLPTLAAYFLNPVAVLIVGYHGQFEALASLPILIAVWLREYQVSTSRLVTWALGALSLLVKHLLVFQVWMLYTFAFGRYARVTAAALAGVAFAVSFAPFWSGGSAGIVRNVLGYGGLPGIYGFGAVLPRVVTLPMFAAAMTILPNVARDRLGLRLPDSLTLSAVALLVMIDGIGEQYFLVPILFGAVHPRRGFWLYTVVAGTFLLASPNNVAVLPPFVPWSAVWLAAAVWCADLLVAARRQRALAQAT